MLKISNAFVAYHGYHKGDTLILFWFYLNSDYTIFNVFIWHLKNIKNKQWLLFKQWRKDSTYSNFLCFMLVSGECLAFVFFRTVVKLIMLHYSLQEKKFNVKLCFAVCRMCLFSIWKERVIQHLPQTNKKGATL